MRSMTSPTQDVENIYDICVRSVGIAELQVSLATVATQIAAFYADYDAKARTGELCQILPDERPRTAIFLNAASKQDFKNLYSQQMVGLEKPARVVYDRILASAPKGKCPLCGFGQAKTLDHYLPKAKYPQFSVHLPNLIPACNDCNFGKRNVLARTIEEQCIHPYFDAFLLAEQWLYAEVVPGAPLAIRYYVRPPGHWGPIEGARVLSHFNDLKLEMRLGVEAADELANVRDTILRHSQGAGPVQISEDLRAAADDRYVIHKNAWQTALYQALAESVWYCEGGFNQI